MKVKSEIPSGVGLKSSSSACNAILKAVFDEYDYNMDRMDVVKLGVTCARLSKVTVTGAFDDACGCEFGGLFVTRNADCEVLTNLDMAEYDVVIYVPDDKKRCGHPDHGRMQALAPALQNAIRTAARRPFVAMTENGQILAGALGLDNNIAERALEAGALGAGISGSGPAVAAVFAPGGGVDRFAKNLAGGRVIITKTRGSES